MTKLPVDARPSAPDATPADETAIPTPASGLLPEPQWITAERARKKGGGSLPVRQDLYELTRQPGDPTEGQIQAALKLPAVRKKIRAAQGRGDIVDELAIAKAYIQKHKQ